jgi:copper(I)-binding protein
MKTISTIALAMTAAIVGCSKTSETANTVEVSEAWCRAAPAGAPAGGCYAWLKSASDDRLIAVETPAAERGEIHTMEMTDGVMRMRPLPDGIELPAGKPVQLMPGARHLMIIGPRQPLLDGGTASLTLRFEKAAPVTVDAPIRAVVSGEGHH